MVTHRVDLVESEDARIFEISDLFIKEFESDASPYLPESEKLGHMEIKYFVMKKR